MKAIVTRPVHLSSLKNVSFSFPATFALYNLLLTQTGTNLHKIAYF